MEGILLAYKLTSDLKLPRFLPDQTTCKKKREAQWDQTELRSKPKSVGTPCETHLSLGYASIGLSRQAGGGEKQEGDASKPLSTSTQAQLYHLCVHVWYLSNAHVKVFVVYSAGDRVRPVEMGLLHHQSCRFVIILITGRLRWNLQPWCQTHCSCLTILFKSRNPSTTVLVQVQI